MAKKIEGWIEFGRDRCPAIVQEYSRNRTDQAATIVIHEGKPERVLTESEVKAKDDDLRWALTWINNEAKHLREIGEPQLDLEMLIEMLLDRHGITLDPTEPK
jgi:hypothetical protein